MNEKYIMEVGANAWKEFLEKNLVKKGENEMNTKETLNKIYGQSTATNAPIKDNITQEDIMNTIKTVEEEEYIWVKGFKGTDKDMRCKDDYQYEFGKQFDLDADVEPVTCSKGFHFCKDLESVFRYYKIGDGNRFFEVEALVKKSALESKNKSNVCAGFDQWTKTYMSFANYDDKYAAKSIRFIRELTVDEVFDIVTDSEVRGWAEEQKRRAMETSIRAVKNEIREETLISAGYSPAFAKYIAGDSGRYTTAMTMASLPDVSMDVKVMAIFMDNQGD